MNKYILSIILLFPSIVNATELVIINHTGAEMRIEHLQNKCDGFLVNTDKPIFIKQGLSKVFTVSPVIQTYEICGSGFCTQSAMGMKGASYYLLDVVIEEGYITGVAKPDHWVGNLECPK